MVVNSTVCVECRLAVKAPMKDQAPSTEYVETRESFEVWYLKIPWGLDVGIWSFRLRGHVYLRTSSMVVSPAKMLRSPSRRSVFIPSSIAFCFNVTVGAR